MLQMSSDKGLSGKEPTNNNEYAINSERASDELNARLAVAVVEPDARRENQVLQKLLRAPRYFECPEPDWLGSNEDDKKAKKGHKACYICGDINHSGNSCKKDNICITCSVKGHLMINCPNKNVEQNRGSGPCLKCGNTDHDMFACTSDYDSEDLKAMECYVCKKAGHLCCVENRGEEATEASCYVCGQSGHLGLECTKSNVVAFDPQLFCRKCKERGHSRKHCPKKTKLARKWKSWNARRRKQSKQTPTNCTASSQPEQPSLLPIAASCFDSKTNGQP